MPRPTLIKMDENVKAKVENCLTLGPACNLLMLTKSIESMPI